MIWIILSVMLGLIWGGLWIWIAIELINAPEIDEEKILSEWKESSQLNPDGMGEQLLKQSSKHLQQV